MLSQQICFKGISESTLPVINMGYPETWQSLNVKLNLIPCKDGMTHYSPQIHDML